VILLWTAVLGLVGFFSGYIGPLIVAPAAAQGPLLGIFITGPGGAILGALVGVFAAILDWPARAQRAMIMGMAIVVAIGTIYFCVPSPRYVADLADIEILSCAPASSQRSNTLMRLSQIESMRPGPPSTTQWGPRFDRALANNPGLVVNAHIFRTKLVFEGRAAWDQGVITASSWKSADRAQSYFISNAAASCGSFPAGAWLMIRSVGNIGVWPPSGIAELLGMQSAERLPPDLGHLSGQ
jgi:hypothetical protein